MAVDRNLAILMQGLNNSLKIYKESNRHKQNMARIDRELDLKEETLTYNRNLMNNNMITTHGVGNLKESIDPSGNMVYNVVGPDKYDYTLTRDYMKNKHDAQEDRIAEIGEFIRDDNVNATANNILNYDTYHDRGMTFMREGTLFEDPYFKATDKDITRFTNSDLLDWERYADINGFTNPDSETITTDAKENLISIGLMEPNEVWHELDENGNQIGIRDEYSLRWRAFSDGIRDPESLSGWKTNEQWKAKDKEELLQDTKLTGVLLENNQEIKQAYVNLNTSTQSLDSYFKGILNTAYEDNKGKIKYKESTMTVTGLDGKEHVIDFNEDWRNQMDMAGLTSLKEIYQYSQFGMNQVLNMLAKTVTTDGNGKITNYGVLLPQVYGDNKTLGNVLKQTLEDHIKFTELTKSVYKGSVVDKSFENEISLKSFKSALEVAKQTNLFQLFKEGQNNKDKMKEYDNLLMKILSPQGGVNTGHNFGSKEDKEIRKNFYDILNNYAKLYATFPEQARAEDVNKMFLGGGF